MTLSEYKPYWPETTVFWGAGATASLGFPTTIQQGDNLYKWAGTNDISSLRATIQSLDWTLTFNQYLCDLLNVLGHGTDSRLTEIKDDHRKIIRQRCPAIQDDRIDDVIVNLRNDFDWDALKRVIARFPTSASAGDFFRDLLNILDMVTVHGVAIGHNIPYNVSGLA